MSIALEGPAVLATSEKQCRSSTREFIFLLIFFGFLLELEYSFNRCRSDARDMGIAPGLVKVLASCHQEVPGFLLGGGAGLVNTNESFAADSGDVW